MPKKFSSDPAPAYYLFAPGEPHLPLLAGRPDELKRQYFWEAYVNAIKSLVPNVDLRVPASEATDPSIGLPIILDNDFGKIVTKTRRGARVPDYRLFGLFDHTDNTRIPSEVAVGLAPLRTARPVSSVQAEAIKNLVRNYPNENIRQLPTSAMPSDRDGELPLMQWLRYFSRSSAPDHLKLLKQYAKYYRDKFDSEGKIYAFGSTEDPVVAAIDRIVLPYWEAANLNSIARRIYAKAQRRPEMLSRPVLSRLFREEMLKNLPTLIEISGHYVPDEKDPKIIIRKDGMQGLDAAVDEFLKTFRADDDVIQSLTNVIKNTLSKPFQDIDVYRNRAYFLTPADVFNAVDRYETEFLPSVQRALDAASGKNQEPPQAAPPPPVLPAAGRPFASILAKNLPFLAALATVAAFFGGMYAVDRFVSRPPKKDKKKSDRGAADLEKQSAEAVAIALNSLRKLVTANPGY